MIYRRPPLDAPVDQGDVIDGCPLVIIAEFDPANPSTPTVEHAISRVVVLTQTCDLANQKVSQVIVARVLDAAELVASGQLKASDVRGPIRAGRVFGWYFLPKSDDLGVGEMIVDLRHLHTIRLDILSALSQSGRRVARVEPLYREHLNKHFADSYSRIGLPEPYETE
jgi:hypothetical protein